MILSVGIILVCILLFLAVRPKGAQPSQPLMQSTLPTFVEPVSAPATMRQLTFRQQQVDEEAAEVSAAFRDAANKKWREEVIAKASTLLTP
jgi:hypothetical protein